MTSASAPVESPDRIVVRPTKADFARVPSTRTLDGFKDACTKGNLVPMYERVMSDQMTPVSCYRALVKEDDREQPSFLFESVVNGNQQGRYSFVGAHPQKEIIAEGNKVTVIDNVRGTRTVQHLADPMSVPAELSRNFRPVLVDGLPDVFTGGWVGYTGYETVRYVYASKIPFESAPVDDRNLPDIHLALYNDVVVFDQATKLAYAITWVHVDEHASAEEGFAAGKQRLQDLVRRMTSDVKMASGVVALDTSERSAWSKKGQSNMSKEEFLAAVAKTKEHIQAGDIFQLVLSHRFERRTFADPFEVYRALRVVNPSPYMVYMQARGCILVASSPEILCRVDQQRVVTNRPLAGTRRRGETEEVDK